MRFYSEWASCEDFFDIGANINIITLDFYDLLVRQGLKTKFAKAPKTGTKNKLVGTQSIIVFGDKVRFQLDVGTIMGKIGFEHEIYISEIERKCFESAIITILGKLLITNGNMMNTKLSRTIYWREQYRFPEEKSENWEQFHFDPHLPDLSTLKSIVKHHEKSFFQRCNSHATASFSESTSCQKGF